MPKAAHTLLVIVPLTVWLVDPVASPVTNAGLLVEDWRFVNENALTAAPAMIPPNTTSVDAAAVTATEGLALEP